MSQGLHSLLWHDEEVAAYFASRAELSGMIRFEAALATAQAAVGIASAEAAAAIATACREFEPDMTALRFGISRDGMAVPELVRQLRAAVPEQFRDAVHYRCTSQDVIDTVFVLAAAKALALIEERLTGIAGQLEGIGLRAGSTPQMARTRMQRALPIVLGDRIQSWRAPLLRHLARLGELRPRLLVLQCGGPIGIDDGPWLAGLARELGLGVPDRSWHSARDGFADLASWLSMVAGAAGKIGQDIAMMAQNEIGEALVADGGKSSAMHHKSNPVAAEIVVALARRNAVLLGGVHQALIHEQERSGSAWALEWMTLPVMFETTAAALQHCAGLLSSTTFGPGSS